MLDSINHMKLKLFLNVFGVKTFMFCHLYVSLLFDFIS